MSLSIKFLGNLDRSPYVRGRRLGIHPYLGTPISLALPIYVTLFSNIQGDALRIDAAVIILFWKWELCWWPIQAREKYKIEQAEYRKNKGYMA